eukprot:6466510-Amphidinium_carterae.1
MGGPASYLHFYNNKLIGELPTAGLRAWTKLTFLLFGKNQLSGVVPDVLSAMSVMYCELVGNHLSGMLPWTLDKMLQMHIFFIGDNRITGSLPGSICSMRHLAEFRISDNKLAGTLPEFGLKHSTTLIRFDLDRNMFSHTLPEEGLQGMTMLFTLRIANNMIVGSLPEEGMMSTPLCNFAASSNKLTGTMVALTSCKFWAQLYTVSDNHFQGTLPTLANVA